MLKKFCQLTSSLFKNGICKDRTYLTARLYQSLCQHQGPSRLRCETSLLGALNHNLILDPTSSLKIQNPGRKSLIDSINDIPFKPVISYTDIIPDDVIVQDPSTTVIEKKAARLIVIRRRKMKRHRLKKLRMRMKFAWAKVRQKREMRKEKAFQAELMGKINEAKKFDPTIYAAEKIRKANEVITYARWRSQNMPEFYLKELIEKKENKMRVNIERAQRRKGVDLDPSHYKY